MPCYHPRIGYRARRANPSGKRSIVWNKNEGFVDLPVQVPCGQCIGCRLERSRQWAIRCVHEASLHRNNCFITLTYNNENLPEGGTLVVKHFQDFMKRLRFHLSNETPGYEFRTDDKEKIKFFHCGEYGEENLRPHYHACLFGVDFADRRHYKTKNDIKHFRSQTLEKLWDKGNSDIGDVTFESAAYVARYITKKVTGPKAEEHYQAINKDTGEIVQRLPEYITMSRRPGIAKAWYEKFKNDVYPSGSVVVRGKEMKPPKFYSSQLEKENPEEFARQKAKSQNHAKHNAEENSHERLKVKKFIKEQKITALKRDYEGNEDA